MSRNPVDIESVAKRFQTRVRLKRYRMWMHVPHIRDTAIVIDETVPRGGQKLIQNPSEFPKKIDENYIEEAVQNNAYSLGRMSEHGKFTPWKDVVGDYPPGYFTHRIGEDVSGK